MGYRNIARASWEWDPLKNILEPGSGVWGRIRIHYFSWIPDIGWVGQWNTLGSIEPELDPIVDIAHKVESSEYWKGKQIYHLLEKAEVHVSPDHKQTCNYGKFLVSLLILSQCLQYIYHGINYFKYEA